MRESDFQYTSIHRPRRNWRHLFKFLLTERVQGPTRSLTKCVEQISVAPKYRNKSAFKVQKKLTYPSTVAKYLVVIWVGIRSNLVNSQQDMQQRENEFRGCLWSISLLQLQIIYDEREPLCFVLRQRRIGGKEISSQREVEEMRLRPWNTITIADYSCV